MMAYFEYSQLGQMKEILCPVQCKLCSVNDVTEGSTQEAHMCASCVLPRKVDKMEKLAVKKTMCASWVLPTMLVRR